MSSLGIWARLQILILALNLYIRLASSDITENGRQLILFGSLIYLGALKYISNFFKILLKESFS